MISDGQFVRWQMHAAEPVSSAVRILRFMTNGDGQRKERRKTRQTDCIHAASKLSPLEGTLRLGPHCTSVVWAGRGMRGTEVILLLEAALATTAPLASITGSHSYRCPALVPGQSGSTQECSPPL